MSIKKKLQKELRSAGLDEGLAEIINITSESEIAGIISKLKGTTSEEELDFNKILSSKEFNEFVEKNGIEKVLEKSKSLQSESDKKVKKGIDTFKKKFLTDEIDEEKGEGAKGDDPDEKEPKWAKDLREKMEKMEQKTSNESKLEKAKAVFEKSETLKKLPEKLRNRYLNGIDLEGETSYEDQVKSLEEEVSELNFGSKGGSPGLPIGGKPSKEVTDKELEEVFG